MSGKLTEEDRAVLRFARTRWLHAGARDTAIRETFGLSTVRYDQWLNTLIDNPAAYVEQPVLVKRLLRLREVRRSRRMAG